VQGPGADEEVATEAGLESPSPEQAPLMATLLRFELAHRQRSVARMRACFADAALVESVASDGQVLGADDTVNAIAEAFSDGVYAIGDWQYEQLLPEVVLSWTGARHRADEGGMRDETVYRLISGQDGLMWRVKLFRNRTDALAHLASHGTDLGL